MECRAVAAVVADHPMRHHRGNAMARRVLSRLPHKPCDRHSDDRPSPARKRRQPCTWAPGFLVSGQCAYACAYRAACIAAGCETEAGALTHKTQPPPRTRWVIYKACRQADMGWRGRSRGRMRESQERGKQSGEADATRFFRDEEFRGETCGGRAQSSYGPSRKKLGLLTEISSNHTVGLLP
jgi:hypothetical protein